MTKKELYKEIIDQAIDHQATHEIRITVQDVSSIKDPDPVYYIKLLESGIYKVDDIEYVAHIYINNIKRNKRGLLNISNNIILDNIQAHIHNYFNFLDNNEPQIDIHLPLKDYNSNKNLSKLIKFIKYEINEYNKFDQEIKKIYKDQIIKFNDNINKIKNELNNLCTKNRDMTWDYNPYDKYIVKEMGKLTGLDNKTITELIQIIIRFRS